MRTRAWALAAAGAMVLLAAGSARADEAKPITVSANAETTTSVTTAPATTATTTNGVTTYAEVDAPPPQRPRKNSVVAEASLGALGFAGKFRHVAPTAIWFHALLGYEPARWVMVFAEGELAYTDTSEAVDETRQRAFPIFGGGAGLRATWHATERVALYLQGAVDVLEADTIKNELGILGYEGMEKLRPAYGGRLGVEWYQRDRHLALALAGGVRDATGFAPSTGVADTPLIWDAAASIRYSF